MRGAGTRYLTSLSTTTYNYKFRNILIYHFIILLFYYLIILIFLLFIIFFFLLFFSYIFYNIYFKNPTLNIYNQ